MAPGKIRHRVGGAPKVVPHALREGQPLGAVALGVPERAVLARDSLVRGWQRGRLFRAGGLLVMLAAEHGARYCADDDGLQGRAAREVSATRNHREPLNSDRT